ncbi:MAG: 23S rRNA (uracil(1939)-C(5))-methyltransferase RlmD, partial [Acholeplasmatales bacterium]|nr:23S rRNA (uracil(1939)-C(5))-methyltransferase RlmD [Acholeplasmatales bacterium]
AKIVEVQALREGINAEAICEYQKKILFVPNMLKDEQAKVEIVQENDKYAYGRVLTITKASNLRISPKCPYYYNCGVCTIGHTTIENEATIKNEILKEAFHKYAFPLKRLEPINQSLNEYHYRNKVVLPIRFIDNKNYFGLLKPRTNHFHQIDTCIIQDETINETLSIIIKALDDFHINGLNIKQNEGIVSFVVVRCAYFTRQTQVTFILVKDCDLAPIVNRLKAQCKSLVSISKVINTKTDSKMLFNESETLVYGEPYITEILDNYNFRLFPSSFFQLNTPVALNIYNKIVQIVQPLKAKIAIDAYSGVGTIGIFLAKVVDKIYSIDSEQANFLANKKNLLINDIKNIKLINKDFLLGYKEVKQEAIDLIVLDPPRTGLGLEVATLLLESKIPYLIYLSCNPATLAKDLKILNKFYELTNISTFNMFPHTPHIETLCLLKRVNSFTK